MKILFITRIINHHDTRAGFVWGWLKEFGEQLANSQGSLMALAWHEGAREGLEGVVGVYAVRRDSSNRLRALMRLFGYIFRLIRQNDAIFIHQHPVYAIVAAPLAKLFRKKIYLWYVHKHVDLKLKIAVWLVDGIFTASHESFRLATKRPVYRIGHGIDTEVFRPREKKNSSSEVFRILVADRVSPIKGHKTVLETAAIMADEEKLASQFEIRIVGSPALNEDEEYFNRLQTMAVAKRLHDIVQFAGAKTHEAMVEEYQNADVLVNLSDTGSLDKTVLEAMACGIPVVTSNEAFRGIISAVDNNLYVTKEAKSIAQALVYVCGLSKEKRDAIGTALRDTVIRDHNLKTLIGRILRIMGN